MERVIIAFAGAKGAGKTTAFKTALEGFPGVAEFTLAGHLKKVCAQVFNIDEINMHDPNLKEKELQDPIFLEPQHIDSVIRLFGYTPDYDVNVRPFIGKVLTTPRNLLQYIGTEVLQTIDPLIHVLYAAKNMPKSGIVVITDLRFLQEFDYFTKHHSQEFKPIYIKNSKAELMAEADNHPSEKQLLLFRDRCDRIDNEGSIQQFKVDIFDKIFKLTISMAF